MQLCLSRQEIHVVVMAEEALQARLRELDHELEVRRPTRTSRAEQAPLLTTCRKATLPKKGTIDAWPTSLYTLIYHARLTRCGCFEGTRNAGRCSYPSFMDQTPNLPNLAFESMRTMTRRIPQASHRVLHRWQTSLE